MQGKVRVYRKWRIIWNSAVGWRSFSSLVVPVSSGAPPYTFTGNTVFIQWIYYYCCYFSYNRKYKVLFSFLFVLVVVQPTVS